MDWRDDPLFEDELNLLDLHITHLRRPPAWALQEPPPPITFELIIPQIDGS